MSSTRTWSVGAAVVSVLLVLAAWFLLVGPKRSDAASLQQQRVSQLTANDQLRLDIAQLKAQNASLPAKQAELAVIQRQMPNNPALPTLIRSLSSLAGQAGLQLSSIAPGAPQQLSATTTTGPAGTSGTTGSTAASATASPVVAIPVTVITTGSYAENELFLQKLQTAMTRAFLVQGIAVAPGQTTTSSSGTSTTSTTSSSNPGDVLTLTITGEVFVLPTTVTPPATTAAGASASTVTPAKTTGSAS